MLLQPEQAPTARAELLTVFVCGPALSGEVLSGLTVRDGAVVWEGGTEPAPQPVEPIRAVHQTCLSCRTSVSPAHTSPRIPQTSHPPG